MERRPGAEEGPDEEPGDSGLPGASGAPQPPDGGTRDARLAGFARGGEWDSAAPSAALAVVLQDVSGIAWRCPGAEHDELFGVLRQWAALESWAAAGKLGLLRSLMREEDLPLPGGDHHGDLPDGWTQSLTHEVSAALAMSPRSAESLMWQAWDLQATLPGIGGLLADGTLTAAKAKAVAEALGALSDQDKARAEAMILPKLAGKTYLQAERLAVQAAITVDPDSAARRREDAERRKSHVSLKREPSGAASLAGYDLPTDETLAAYAHVCARAQEYKDSRVFPDVRMDQFRAQAYLDILNGIPADARIAAGQPDSGLGARTDDDPDDPDDDQDHGPGAGPDGNDPDDGPSGPACPRSPAPPAEPSSPPPARSPAPPTTPPAPPTTSPAPPAESPGSSATPPAFAAALPRPADLVMPLATLLGLAWRPGEGHGLGPLDPELCRALAVTAAASPHSTLCVTVTSAEGYAIGHGCARPDGRRAPRSGTGTSPAADTSSGAGATSDMPRGSLTALPARMNLTITASLLAQMASGGPGPAETGSPPARASGQWSFHRVSDAGPPDNHGRRRSGDTPPDGRAPEEGYGTWELTLPDGTVRIVRFEPVPTADCDHRHEAHAYQPGDLLRHLVQVRDGECTFPTCSRHARESDFEHAVPYHRGGRTCGCNAGARSRQCHRVKQSPGWNVTQPRPGWHRWTTPSGRVYVQEPKRYLV
jgi:hypothetical protein